MRRVGDESLLPFHVGGDLVEQPVDRDGEPVEFVARAGHRQAVAESGRPQPLGGGEDEEGGVAPAARGIDALGFRHFTKFRGGGWESRGVCSSRLYS